MKRRTFLMTTPGMMMIPSALADEIIKGARQPGDETYDDVIAISSLLTGVPERTFREYLERDDNPSQGNLYWYFSVVQTAYGSGPVEDLLILYRKLVEEHATNEQIADSIFLNAEPEMKSLSGMIMKMWMLGVWLGQSEGTLIPNPDLRIDFVISSKAYANSFAWKIARAHPMGYSNFPFGSWGKEPPTLQHYGIET